MRGWRAARWTSRRAWTALWRPDLPLLSRLSGTALVKARKGAIEATVPAFLALALATDTFNAFDGHERIRYDEVDTLLRFGEGRVSTEAFDIDGPDLRMFVAGELDLLRAPHLLDAELALFLFRHIDQALVNIPIVNSLLLGGNDNLMAAYFSLKGPWEDPGGEPPGPANPVREPGGRRPHRHPEGDGPGAARAGEHPGRWRQRVRAAAAAGSEGRVVRRRVRSR